MHNLALSSLTLSHGVKSQTCLTVRAVETLLQDIFHRACLTEVTDTRTCLRDPRDATTRTKDEAPRDQL